MASFNRVILLGNLTHDPELKYLPSGTAVATIRVATNRVYTDRQSGEKKEEVCFVDVVAWERQAELCNEYLSKGRPVLIEGRLRYRTWETEDGQKRSKHEVVAERVQFIGSPQQQSMPSAATSGEKTGESEAISDDDIPF